VSVFSHVRMKVDQITITSNIPALQQSLSLKAKFWTLPSAIKKYFSNGRCTVPPPKNSGVIIASIYPDKTNKDRMIAALIVGVTESSHRYFSLTLYPGKMSPSEFFVFKVFLAGEFPQYAYANLFATGRVSRIDLAIDILSVPKSALFPYRPKCRTVTVLEAGGTTYLGSKTSGLMFRIYDKVKQLLETGKPAAGHACITRVEARLKATKSAPCELAQNLKNPFTVLHLAELQVLRDTATDPLWHEFLDRAEVHGHCVALASIPKSTRGIFSKRLKACGAWWWQPAELWKGIGPALAWLDP
jgi:hypothetical protein